MKRTLDEWLAWIEGRHPKSIDMGLERVRAVAGHMQLPRPARHVITVAGTNGKGSTVAFIEAIASGQGWRTGAYTSPHLFHYSERVRIDGRPASDDALVEAFEAVEAARTSATDVSLTYFEYGTLVALWLFARQPLDLVVLEVGLGGRLDATNIVDADVAVVTTVDLDHSDWLGADREAIGREKAGIARPWKPLILGEDDPPASVLRHAYAIGAAAIRANCDFMFAQLDATQWRWRDVGHEMTLPVPAMRGAAQLRNAAAAIAALRALDAPVSDPAIARGVAAARVPGRLEAFELDGVEVMVDVGHNPQAAREVAAWLHSAPVRGSTRVVLAALADKDVAGVVDALSGQVQDWHLAGLEHVARGLAVDALAGRLAGTAAASAARHASVPEAIRAARAASSAGDRIVVLGSFHTAAAALGLLHGRH
ncbi:MAG: bifunctional tetrahydrofolate synthase/dihydrofolate synthase [Gammaproteobacteria bacterium]|nr:bifunctional tetrahydrofolate synthase/dihydrofolate synthase [Gammaproteobacteria bacterium]